MGKQSRIVNRNLAKRLVGTALLAAVILVGFVVWEIARTPSPPAFPPTPSPNGYDDFLKASRLIAHLSLELTNSNPELLRPLVQENQAALALIRAGINRECRVPLQFTRDYLSTHMDEFGGFKAAARLLGAEGAVAEADGRLKDAVQAYLDAVRFGQASSRGGLVIDVMVGAAIQAVGVKKLHGLRERFSSAELRNAARILNAIDHDGEPADLLIQRERAYFRKVQGLWSTTWLRLMSRLPWMRALNTEPISESAILRGRAALRLLIVELSLHNYKLDHGRFPSRLAALAPNYLNAVPTDPFTGSDFVYRQDDSGYRLYSIGPDRTDDGGKPLGGRSKELVPQGDVILD